MTIGFAGHKESFMFSSEDTNPDMAIVSRTRASSKRLLKTGRLAVEYCHASHST
jgi:hypothetical protein